MNINVKAMAIAMSIIWGLGIFCITWWIIIFDGPNTDSNLLTQLYRGYSITPAGSIIGLIWALVDGAIVGAGLAWIYNGFASKGNKE